MSAFALVARSREIDLERVVLRWFDELGQLHTISRKGDAVVGLVDPDRVDGLADRVLRMRRDSGVALHLGVGAAASLEALASSASQALTALAVARAEGEAVRRFGELGTARLLGAADEHTRRSLASRLDPIEGAQAAGIPSVDILRAYLVEHGNVLATAKRLGVHRHTVGAAIAAVERATGLSMASVDDRATAWFALAERDRSGRADTELRARRP